MLFPQVIEQAKQGNDDPEFGLDKSGIAGTAPEKKEEESKQEEDEKMETGEEKNDEQEEKKEGVKEEEGTKTDEKTEQVYIYIYIEFLFYEK